MAFSQLSQFMSGGSNNQYTTPTEDGNPGGVLGQQLGLDSITLGQLRAMVGSAPKPKQSYYDFRYDDEDTVMNELDEFYSYVEMPQVAENLKAWEGSYPGEWIKSNPAQRKAHVEVLLEGLEHRDAIVRFLNARRLLYILQGTFAETISPEHQLHWILENGKAVRAADGLSNVIEAMKIANSRHDFLSSLTDAEVLRFNISVEDKADLIEEVNTEISVYLGMLYHLIEVFKGHDDFADELMSLDTPLPVYLYNVVAGLRDKSARGYPVKKLLMVLWKTLLATCGGIRELDRVKKLSRDLSGLAPVLENEGLPIKSTPIDIDVFHQETTVKYPSFSPAPAPTVAPTFRTDKLTEKLAEAYNPIPVRHHYHHDDDSHMMHSNHPGMFHNGANSAFRPVPQAATPAPTPPASPKPTKKMYQTDQTRPFLFPFSSGEKRLYNQYDTRSGGTVPFAIDEAERLYNKHMYISLSLWQMWRTREECMTSESGLDVMARQGGSHLLKSASLADDEEAGETLPDMMLLEARFAQAEEALRKAESVSDQRKAKELREDLARLKRVEVIYSSILPVMSGWVLVVLKLLLATVSAATGANPPPSATGNGFPPGVSPPSEQPPAPPPTLEEIDIIRHREITSKAVSAILLLTLKWFKASHVMKFHHLGQLLLDTNCLLLILKMFGLQEVSASVVSKADSPEHSFFRYCQTHFTPYGHQNGEEDDQGAQRKIVARSTLLPNGQYLEEEVELLTDFSWRNFFSTINFAKIMQKLSKHRSHRIWMLVQYKSSAVLKRVLRVSHPMLQLHILKLIKSQVPFCGRKWRQSNMKVITSIYLNCRPDLRDEWLTGTEADDVGDAQAQEQALRHLVKFYNSKRYGSSSLQPPPAHRRTTSISQNLEGLLPGPDMPIVRPVGTPNVIEADVFPPLRAQAQDPTSNFLPFIAEDIAFEEEYEEYLSDLGMSASEWSQANDHSANGGGASAWDRLPELAAEFADNISDSESVVSIHELGDDARINLQDGEQPAEDANVNNWEHMSPKTMAALPKSPHKSPAARRSSQGGSLRPVMPLNLDDPDGGSAVDDELEEVDLPEPGPMPRSPGTFATTPGGGVDEVEYAYGI